MKEVTPTAVGDKALLLFLSSFLFLFPAVLLAAVKDLEEDKKEAEEILLTAVKNKIPTAFELDKEAAIFKCSSYNVSF